MLQQHYRVAYDWLAQGVVLLHFAANLPPPLTCARVQLWSIYWLRTEIDPVGLEPEQEND